MLDSQNCQNRNGAIVYLPAWFFMSSKKIVLFRWSEFMCLCYTIACAHGWIKSGCVDCWIHSLPSALWLAACQRQMLLSKSMGPVCLALLGVLHKSFTVMGCIFSNMACSKLRHSPHFPYCPATAFLSHRAPAPCKTNLFVHDELYLPSPKFAMCFRSSVLLSCNSGFPVTIWKYHGISAVWNGSQQTLFRQLMIPQSLSVPAKFPFLQTIFFFSIMNANSPNSPLISIPQWG